MIDSVKTTFKQNGIVGPIISHTVIIEAPMKKAKI